MFLVGPFTLTLDPSHTCLTLDCGPFPPLPHVIESLSGTFAHRPEDGSRIPLEENCMHCLKKQLGGRYLYPVHRLDRATSGVLVRGLKRQEGRMVYKN